MVETSGPERIMSPRRDNNLRNAGQNLLDNSKLMYNSAGNKMSKHGNQRAQYANMQSPDLE